MAFESLIEIPSVIPQCKDWSCHDLVFYGTEFDMHRYSDGTSSDIDDFLAFFDHFIA